MELCDFTLDDYIHTINSNESSLDIDLRNSSTFALVSKNCSLPEKWFNTWTIGSHIARGLEFMHTLKHVHRDLKPANSKNRLISFENTDMCSSYLLSSILSLETYWLRDHEWGHINESHYNSLFQRNRRISSSRTALWSSKIHEEGRHMGTGLHSLRISYREKSIPYWSCCLQEAWISIKIRSSTLSSAKCI